MGWQITIAWALVSLLLLAVNATAVANMVFPDQDDTLRLIQVRDWMAGQSWFDVTQYRMNPPDGAPMHWSRLVDIPIAAGLMLLEPVFGPMLAEKIALAIIPLLTLLCIMQILGRLTHRLFGRETALFVCFAIAVVVPVLHQVRPMRIDHHGWQMVMAMIAFSGAFGLRQKWAGWLIGSAFAVWLHISMEGLPLAAAFMALFALRWIWDHAERARLVHAMAALAGVSLLLYFATNSAPYDVTTFCDALSPVHIAIFTGGAAGIAALAWWNPENRIILMAGFGIMAIAAITAIMAIAPQCSRGAFVDVDPLVRTFWYDNILEGKPIWRQNIVTIFQNLSMPVLALAALWKMRGNAAPITVRQQFTMAFLVFASLATAIFVERAASVACLIALPCAIWFIRQLLLKARTIENSGRRLIATFAAIILLAPGHMVLAASNMLKPKPNAAAQIAAVGQNSCDLSNDLTALNTLPAAQFMVPTDSGPAMLYATHHTVVASGHHRNHLAMRDVISSFGGNGRQARAIIFARNVDYIAYCPSLNEPTAYRNIYPDGLLAQLEAGNVPDWLKPVEIAGTGNLKIWKIVK